MSHLDVAVISEEFTTLEPVLDERARRLWAATEARAIGRGGTSRVAEATALPRITIRARLNELHPGSAPPDRQDIAGRIREPGGGREPLTEHDPKLLRALEPRVDPVPRGDPMAPPRGTCKRAAERAAELRARGHRAWERSVHRLLHAPGYGLPSNRKTIQGGDPPGRDAQSQDINRRVKASPRPGQPVGSVDTEEEELVGRPRNGGREWPPGQTHLICKSLLFKNLGKVLARTPNCNLLSYNNLRTWCVSPGVAAQGSTRGGESPRLRREGSGPGHPLRRLRPGGPQRLGQWGVDHDTAAFAGATSRRWWRKRGSRASPDATKRPITADGGGSNGSRCRLWKVELARLADELGLRISAGHFPPGPSKWDKIEHRRSCHIAEDWRGRPLVSREVGVDPIGHTTTKEGLSIRSELEANSSPLGRAITDGQMKGLSIKPDKFHSEWNYTILPKTSNG